MDFMFLYNEIVRRVRWLVSVMDYLLKPWKLHSWKLGK